MSCGIRIFPPHTYKSIVERPDHSLFLGVRNIFFHYVFAPFFTDTPSKRIIVSDQCFSFFNNVEDSGERLRVLIGIYDFKNMVALNGSLSCPKELSYYIKTSIFTAPNYVIKAPSDKCYIKEISCTLTEMWDTADVIYGAIAADLLRERGKCFVTLLDVIKRIFYVVDMCPCIDFFIWTKDINYVLGIWPERNIFPTEGDDKTPIMFREHREREAWDKESLLFRDNVWLGVPEEKINKSAGVASILCNGLFTYEGK